MSTSGRSVGFTLIEVQITIVLVVIGMVGLSGAMVSANRCQSASRERLVVSHNLSNQLESIVQTPFDQIVARHDGSRFEIPGVSPASTAQPAGRVQVELKGDDFLEVTVSGDWKGNSGPESLNLSQEIAR